MNRRTSWHLFWAPRPRPAASYRDLLSRRTGPTFLLLALLATCAAPRASAATIDVGTHTLLPNTPNQVIEIIVLPSTPAERVAGVDFVAALAPGDANWVDTVYREGPPSNIDGPVFSAPVDLIGPGTIFSENNVGIDPGGVLEVPRLVAAYTVTGFGSVSSGGVLARLTLDTTGIFADQGADLLYPLSLYQSGGQDNFGLATALYDERAIDVLRTLPDLPPDRITNGFIRIAAAVPEPATWIGFAMALAGIAALARRTGPTFLLMALLATCAAPHASAATIDVGTHTLLPNTPNQTVSLIVTPSFPGEQVAGVDLTAALTNEILGYDGKAPDDELGPFFTGFDLIGPGTIFAANNVGVPPGSVAVFRKVLVASTLTAAGTVPAEGVLARLVIDTTGVDALPNVDQLFPLALSAEIRDETASHTLFVTMLYDERAEQVLTYTNGFIRIAAAVPEPATWIGFAMALAGLAALVRRRKA